uniref:Protein kinase domain-containing protein n=2 Tax=Auxenochlorella protothecoides TaxID=3075 RepID=A0A1D2AEM3_AUXPR
MQRAGLTMRPLGLMPQRPGILPAQTLRLGALNVRPARVRRSRHIAHALPSLDLLHIFNTGLALLPLAYEPVVLPCHTQNCGDQVHRSTLDPVLRLEQKGINPQGVVLCLGLLVYLFATPGVLPGAIDTYIKAPLQRLRAQPYCSEDFTVGKKVASGGFGTVYRAEMKDPRRPGETRPVILKKATEFGEAEAWMNERMARTNPLAVADFVAAFTEFPSARTATDPLWLVWQFEGEHTLAELMVRKDFPQCLAPLLFEDPSVVPPGVAGQVFLLKTVMQQLLEGLAACHSTGIVHRDVKPHNCIVSTVDRRIKLIDFGAAADLRIGINYVPNQYLLDPRYAPPQQYIMSKHTPRAPAAPVAALLSPVVWALNSPDRFDMYSVGIMMLQLALPPLRTDNALVAFNKQLADTYKHDLRAWRRARERRGTKDLAAGLAILDADGGAGWDLACNLVQYRPEDRLSAQGALRHPWFDTSPLARLGSAFGDLTQRVSQATTGLGGQWLGEVMARSGTAASGGFTEAQLSEELEEDGEVWQAPPKDISSTIAWWQQREARLQKAARVQQRKAAKQLVNLRKDTRNTVKEIKNRVSLLYPLLGGRSGRETGEGT